MSCAGMGMMAFRKPRAVGVALLNTIQDCFCRKMPRPPEWVKRLCRVECSPPDRGPRQVEANAV